MGSRPGLQGSCGRRSEALPHIAEPVIGRAFARSSGFAHPADCELICFACKRNLDTQLRQNNTTGKSVKTCPAPRAKIFRLTCRANHRHNSARLTADEGRSRSSRTCGEMRWTRNAQRRRRVRRTAKSCGSGVAVLALSPGEAKLLGGDGGKRAVLREEHEVNRKAIAQGRPECSRCPVCSCAVLFAQIARETAGAASTRSSLRPLIFRRAR